MARIRTIKPEFWTDEKVVTLSVPARLLFIGIWNFVDDFGRVEFSPMRLKMQIFPADSLEVSPLLQEITEAGLIQIYDVDDKRYLQVSNFRKHQATKNDAKEKLPPPPKGTELSRKVLLEKEKEKVREKVKTPSPNGDARSVELIKPSSLPAATKKPESDEERFWSLATELEPQGVARSRVGQLANLLNGDFGDGVLILRDVAKAKEPSKYLGAVIRNCKAEHGGPGPPRNGTVPPWVSAARNQGYDVTREGIRWRMAGALYDDAGEQVGC